MISDGFYTNLDTLTSRRDGFWTLLLWGGEEEEKTQFRILFASTHRQEGIQWAIYYYYTGEGEDKTKDKATAYQHRQRHN